MIFHFRELVSGSWSCARWLIRTFDGSWAVVNEICFTCLFPSKTSQSDCSENDLCYNKNDKRYDTCYLLNRKNTKWIFSFGVCWLAHISQVQQNIQTFNYSKARHILQRQRTAECVFGSCSCMEGMKKKHHIILCNLYCSSEVQWKGSTSKRWHTLYLAAYTFTCNILPLTSRSPFSLPCSVFRHHAHISLSRLRERVLPGVVCHQCRTSDCAVTAVIFRAGEFRAAQILTPEGQRLNSTVCLPAGVHGGTISGPI